MNGTTKLFGAALALLAACGSDGGGGTGAVTLKLTDAPGDFAAAVVTVEQVYLTAGGSEVRLSSTRRTVNLVDLANATVDLATDAVVPAGRYEQLRFVISGGYIEVEESPGVTRIYATSPDYEGLPAGTAPATVGELRMPSFATSGLKVNLTNGLVVNGGDRKIVLVDFVVAESYGHVAGNSGAWVMHPVVHAGEITLSGGLRVVLAPAQGVTVPAGIVAALSYPALVDGVPGTVTESLPLADPEADGTWEASFLFLFPRTFSLDLVPPAGTTTFTTSPPEPTIVTVVSNADAVASFTLTGVAQPAPQ